MGEGEEKGLCMDPKMMAAMCTYNTGMIEKGLCMHPKMMADMWLCTYNAGKIDWLIY